MSVPDEALTDYVTLPIALEPLERSNAVNTSAQVLRA